MTIPLTDLFHHGVNVEGGRRLIMCIDNDESCEDQGSPTKPTSPAEFNSPAVAKKDSNAKKKWKKPKDMPKRPLSAYNLFFAEERRQLLHGGDTDFGVGDSVSGSSLIDGHSNKNLGFAGLARSVATKWKTLNPAMKAPYEELARREKARYNSQIKKYNDQRLRTQTKGSRPSSPASSISTGRQLSHESLDEQVSAPLWPAMPQTIASLGSIYDADHELSSGNAQMASLKTDYDQMEKISPAALRIHKGMLESASELAARQHPANSLSFPTRSFQERLGSSTPRRSISDPFVFFQEGKISPRQHQNQGPATKLSDPAGITKLASELDEDQVDFLQLLKESNEE
jgi:hypothetical protein